MADFTLRPMESTDGPAIDALMRHEGTDDVGEHDDPLPARHLPSIGQIG
jgi:hypothetical protein